MQARSAGYWGLFITNYGYSQLTSYWDTEIKLVANE